MKLEALKSTRIKLASVRFKTITVWQGSLTQLCALFCDQSDLEIGLRLKGEPILQLHK